MISNSVEEVPSLERPGLGREERIDILFVPP
jgi:hypothetical protein